MKYDTFIFDLDDTLAESKSDISNEMKRVLCDLLSQAKVCIITGGLPEQIKNQVVSHLSCTNLFSNLYLQPTSGGSLHTWNLDNESWEEEYNSNLPGGTFIKIQSVFDSIIPQYTETLQIPEKLYGAQLEDRGSQISFSALGQDAPANIKKEWDPERKKRLAILDDLQAALPDLEVRIGGTTTIDISLKGRDKAYGIKKFYEHTGANIENGIFIGDSIFPGGNDYAAIKTGIETQQTTNPEETIKIIKTLLQK